MAAVESLHSGSERWVVPIFSMDVTQRRMPAAGKNHVYTGVDFNAYFITPESAMAGRQGERLSYIEAMNRMVF